jgi:hypothetical protein
VLDVRGFRLWVAGRAGAEAETPEKYRRACDRSNRQSNFS